jgi:Ca2+-binding EF-hand superfamily protein
MSQADDCLLDAYSTGQGESSSANEHGSNSWNYDKWNGVGADTIWKDGKEVKKEAERPVIRVTKADVRKVEELFLKYDEDGDKYLNAAEMHVLLFDTTGKKTTTDDYHFFCKVTGAIPSKGLSIEKLLLWYVGTGGPEAGGPDINADHAKIFTVAGPEAPPEPPPKDQVHVSADTTLKVAHIFAKYDKDGDKFLKHPEMSALQTDTEGKGMSEEEYGQFCKFVGANSEEGLNIQHLLLTYVALGSDVNVDYDKIFPLAAAEKAAADKAAAQKAKEDADEAARRAAEEGDVVEIGADGTYAFD